MELEESIEQVLLEMGGDGGGQGQERSMTQTMYAHVNKLIIIIKVII
jgi:hypothetical protein